MKTLTITVTDGEKTIAIKVEGDVRTIGQALGNALSRLGIVTYVVEEL